MNNVAITAVGIAAVLLVSTWIGEVEHTKLLSEIVIIQRQQADDQRQTADTLLQIYYLLKTERTGSGTLCP